jgi:hypothetical protein
MRLLGRLRDRGARVVAEHLDEDWLLMKGGEWALGRTTS